MTVPPGSILNRPVRSMTGFARTRRSSSWGDLTISLRGVNHRGLDFHFHQGSEFHPFESALRSLLKQNIARGHVEVRISLTRTDAFAAAGYNRELVGRYVAAFREAAAAFDIPAEADLNSALRLPGALNGEAGQTAELDAPFEAELLAAAAVCLEEFNSFREREGSELRELLRAEACGIQGKTAEMKSIRADATRQMHERLLERLQPLLGASILDPKRIAEEVALLVDRSDIEEELTRLAIHTSQLLELLNAGGEMGKRIDFLLQEMNRETNTVLSKTSGIGDIGLRMTDLALGAKSHIEKIREQALNVE